MGVSPATKRARAAKREQTQQNDLARAGRSIGRTLLSFFPQNGQATPPAPPASVSADDQEDAVHPPPPAASASALARASPNTPGGQRKGKGKGKPSPTALENRRGISKDVEDEIRRATQASLEDGSGGGGGGGGGSSEPMSGDDDDQGPSRVPAVTSGTKRLKTRASNSDSKKTGRDEEEDMSQLLNTWCPKNATMEGIARFTVMHEAVRSAPIHERPGELLRLAGVAHADVIGPLLDQVLVTHSQTDARLVSEAQAKANKYNRRTLHERDPDASIFRPNGQGFRGSGHISVTGGFPTTCVLDGPDADKLLGNQGNATVQLLSMLMGLPPGGDLGDDHLLSNRIFTTIRGSYTNVPTENHYDMFHRGLVDYRRHLLDGGVKVFVEVTSSNLGSLEEALSDGPTGPLRRYELLHVNGTRLELLAPPQGGAVLALLPHEHLSHVFWGQLNEAGRLQLLLGFHAVVGVLAALLDRPRPRIDDLVTAVKAKTLKPTGIVAGSGAYMEACMRSKLFVFIAVHGETEGRARWLAWYTECKSRAANTAWVKGGKLVGKGTPGAVKITSGGASLKGEASIDKRKEDMPKYLQECADGGHNMLVRGRASERARDAAGVSPRRSKMIDCGCTFDRQRRLASVGANRPRIGTWVKEQARRHIYLTFRAIAAIGNDEALGPT